MHLIAARFHIGSFHYLQHSLDIVPSQYDPLWVLHLKVQSCGLYNSIPLPSPARLTAVLSNTCFMVQAVVTYTNGNSMRAGMRVCFLSILIDVWTWRRVPGSTGAQWSLISIKKLTLKVVLSSRYPVSESCCSCLECFIQRIIFSFTYPSQMSSPHGEPHSAGLGRLMSWLRSPVRA